MSRADIKGLLASKGVSMPEVAGEFWREVSPEEADDAVLIGVDRVIDPELPRYEVGAFVTCMGCGEFCYLRAERVPDLLHAALPICRGCIIDMVNPS